MTENFVGTGRKALVIMLVVLDENNLPETEMEQHADIWCLSCQCFNWSSPTKVATCRSIVDEHSIHDDEENRLWRGTGSVQDPMDVFLELLDVPLSDVLPLMMWFRLPIPYLECSE